MSDKARILLILMQYQAVMSIQKNTNWGNYYLSQYQILQTNIMRILQHTARRSTNEIWE